MVNPSLCWLVGLVVGGLTAGHAAAQPAASSVATPAAWASSPGPSPGDLALRLAFEAAWQRAVQAREAQGQRRRAEADRSAVDTVIAAPPTLELSQRTDRPQGHAGRRELEVGLALPLWLPGQRRARADTGDAALALAAAAVQAARWRLAGEVRESAWRVVSLLSEAQQVDREVELLQQLVSDVERRVQAGDLARADALAAQADHLAAFALQTAVRQRLAAARSNWTLLTGLPALPPLVEANDGVGPTSSPVPHPELQLARETTALARQRLELIRRSRRDAPELSFGVRQETPGRAEPSQGSMVFGLRWPLGNEARNRPLETAALAELDLADMQEQRLRERLDAETVAADAAQRSAALQLEIEVARARLLRERAALIDRSFRAGESPLPEVLRALAAAAQADSAVARQNAALGQARARLQHALGLLP